MCLPCPFFIRMKRGLELHRNLSDDFPWTTLASRNGWRVVGRADDVIFVKQVGGKQVHPETIIGITEASATRSPVSP